MEDGRTAGERANLKRDEPAEWPAHLAPLERAAGLVPVAVRRYPTATGTVFRHRARLCSRVGMRSASHFHRPRVRPAIRTVSVAGLGSRARSIARPLGRLLMSAYLRS